MEWSQLWKLARGNSMQVKIHHVQFETQTPILYRSYSPEISSNFQFNMKTFLPPGMWLLFGHASVGHSRALVISTIPSGSSDWKTNLYSWRNVVGGVHLPSLPRLIPFLFKRLLREDMYFLSLLQFSSVTFTLQAWQISAWYASIRWGEAFKFSVLGLYSPTRAKYLRSSL